MTFLKTVLIILLVYYALKFLLKLAAPYLMRYISKKAGQKFEQAFGGNPNTAEPTEKEGSVTIDKMPNSQSKSKNTVGEYVDFEDLE